MLKDAHSGDIEQGRVHGVHKADKKALCKVMHEHAGVHVLPLDDPFSARQRVGWGGPPKTIRFAPTWQTSEAKAPLRTDIMELATQSPAAASAIPKQHRPKV